MLILIAILLARADAGFLEGKLAGAEGFEPSPSSLTVRCPTSWTTPQRAVFAPDLSQGRSGINQAPPQNERRSLLPRYHGCALRRTLVNKTYERRKIPIGVS